MVQRKVTNKFGIQPDQVKTNKLLVNFKPSSLQHQDAKNRGADLKKKMKKSRPAKRSDIERLGSPNIRRPVPQPGKPPPPSSPPITPIAPASIQKKSPVKTSETTPNYMKDTTCSDARKERSQVSSRNLQTLFDSKSSSRKDSNNSKGSSDHKAPRGLARTSSLKLVRTLTKTTSFKPVTASSAKKCSPFVLSENLDVQRATCSSTLKDSKFPAYLEISSGGTEAQGTSVMKVCLYTYCSLNGHHHHPPLPPLKSFLSARRRMLKTQRSFKLGCLSPRRSKPISMSSMDEIQVEQINFDEKSSNQEPLKSSMTSPVTEEEHSDFFVQIYSKERETTADIVDSSSNHIKPSTESIQMLSDESSFSEMDSHSHSSKNGDVVPSDMEATEYAEEMDQNTEAEEVYSSLQAQEKSKLPSLSWSDSEVKSTGIIPTDNPGFGYADMDCEAENCSTMYLDYEADNSIDFESCIIPEETIFESDIANRCFGGIPADKVLQQSSDEESFDRESVSSNADSYADNQIDYHVEGFGKESCDQFGRQAEDESVNPTKTQDLIDHNKYETGQDDDAAEQIMDPDSQDEIDDYQTDDSNSTISFNGEAFNGRIPPEEKDLESEKNSFEIELDLTTDAENGMEEKDLVDPVKALIRIEICISLQGSAEDTKDKSIEARDEIQLENIKISGKSDQSLPGLDLTDETPDDYSAHKKFTSIGNENLNCSAENEAENSEASASADLGGETHPMPKNASGSAAGKGYPGSNPCQELDETRKNLNWRTGGKSSVEECNEAKEFNPREPNFLPVEPDPDAEKVDLRHQTMDERKNADEWMLDYAIRQAVTKLAPASKKKVALLVKAFETVMPEVPRYESQQRHSSVPFSHARPIQACS